jgi:hypothetical protein
MRPGGDVPLKDVVDHHNGALFAAVRLAGGDMAVNGQSQTQSHFVAAALEVYTAKPPRLAVTAQVVQSKML